MVNYLGNEVGNDVDIDKITTDRIKSIFYDINDELKWHRKAMFAIIVLGNQKNFGKEDIEKANSVMKDLEKIYLKIELFVEEGRLAKEKLKIENDNDSRP